MANIRRKSSGRYEAQVRVKGFAQSKSFDHRADALKWAYQVEADVKMGCHGHVRGKTLFDALDRYEKEVTPKKRGRKAEFNRIQQLKREGFSHLLLDELRDSHIQRFVDDGLSRGLKGSSVNRDLSLLSAVFTISRKKWKWIQHNPLDGVDKPKEPAPRNRRISDDEIVSVLEALKYDPEAKHER